MSRIQWVVGSLCFRVVGKGFSEFGGDSKAVVDGCVVVVVGGQSSVAGCVNWCRSKGLQVVAIFLHELRVVLRGS